MFPFSSQEKPGDPHWDENFSPRGWCWYPVISFRLLWWEIGFEQRLVMWKGKKARGEPIYGKALILKLDPREWKIEQDHIWYDGPHCWYQFGPFCYRKHGLYNCARCSPND